MGERGEREEVVQINISKGHVYMLLKTNSSRHIKQRFEYLYLRIEWL